MKEVDTWYGHWLGGRCATSCCDLELIYDIAVVTLTLKILSGLDLGIDIG